MSCCGASSGEGPHVGTRRQALLTSMQQHNHCLARVHLPGHAAPTRPI